MFSIYEFHWKAQNRFRQKQHGKCLAKSREEVERNLLAKGYGQIRIQRNFVLPSAPKTEEITQILAQLTLLLEAAIPLKQALAMLLENSANIKLYQWFTELSGLLGSGYGFSASLEKSEHYLTEQEIQLIKMGESSGKLGIMLNNIVQARRHSEKLAKKVKKIMFYPAVVLGISLALSIGLLIFIVPQFAELYGDKNQQLPLLTEILFGLSDFLQQQAAMLTFIFLTLSAGVFLFAKKSSFLTACKMKILSGLPVFRQIIEHSRIVFFTQNIALMLGAHIRLDMVLNAFISERVQDPVLQREVQFILTLLRQGYKFADGLNPSVFNMQVVQMIAIGEQSGNLALMCRHISEIYQQKLDYQIELLSQLLEPMLMVLMGLIVGTILIGLYLPIFDMGAIAG